MEHKDVVTRYPNLFYCLSSLPEKIVATHGKENLAELVLYELAHPHCLDFSKAAFFIDNPDFNCVQGMVGLVVNEHEQEDVWHHEAEFTSRMKLSSFNRAVRMMRHQSVAGNESAKAALLQTIAGELRFVNPAWRTFPLKHGNQGMLLFEATPAHQSLEKQVAQAASLLAFCPIF